MILKQGQFVFHPLLNRQPVKRMKHRSDVGRSGSSENECCSIVLYCFGVQKDINSTRGVNRIGQYSSFNIYIC